MNRAQKIMEIVKEPIGGTAKKIWKLEIALGIEHVDLEKDVEDIYDYLSWLEQKAKEMGR